MTKGFKKSIAMALAAAMVFSTPVALNKTVASAAEGNVVELPAPTYLYDFEDGLDSVGTVTGAAAEIVGNGSLVDSQDAERGYVFDNDSSATATTVREKYLKLPQEVIDAIVGAENQTLTVSMWVKAPEGSAESKNYGFHSPLLAMKQADSQDPWPLFNISLKSGCQINRGGYVDCMTYDNGYTRVDYLDDNEWHNITTTISPTNVTVYRDAEVMNTKDCDGTEGKKSDGMFAEDTFDTLSIGGNNINGWNDPDAGILIDDVAIYTGVALDTTQIYKLYTGKDGIMNALISNVKADFDGENIGIAYTKDEDLDGLDIVVNDKAIVSGGAITVNDGSVTVSGAAVAASSSAASAVDLTKGSGAINYAPTEGGKYDISVTGKKEGLYVDDKETADITLIKGGDKLYEEDASLIKTALKVENTTDAYKLSFEAAEGATATLTVTDSKGAVKKTLNASGDIAKKDLTDNEKYSVKLVVVNGTKAAIAEDEFTYLAPKTADAKSKWAQISTQPLLFWEFNDANGLTLAGEANVKDGVLNLATQKSFNKTYAQLPSLTSYDFSKGATIILDVMIKGTCVNDQNEYLDWAGLVTLGDGTLGKGTTGMTYRYGLSQGFSSVGGKNGTDIYMGYFGNGIAAPYTYDYFHKSENQNKWYTIAVTITPTEMKTYINGALAQSAQGSYTDVLDAFKVAKNNYLGTTYWDSDPDVIGAMDDVAFYNTALSADDIVKLKAAAAEEIKVTGDTKNVGTNPNARIGATASISFLDGPTVSKNRKKITAEFTVKPDKVTATGSPKSVKISGKKVTITYKKALKIGKKIKVTVTKGTTKKSKTVTVKGTITISKVKAKKGTKKITGKLNIKKATVKVKVGKKKYKKAKVKGKTFTFKTSKLKKGTKVKIKVTKKNYKTKTKTVKVK